MSDYPEILRELADAIEKEFPIAERMRQVLCNLEASRPWEMIEHPKCRAFKAEMLKAQKLVHEDGKEKM